MTSRTLFLAAALLLAAAARPALAQEIAITLDDLPHVMPSRTTPQEGLAQPRPSQDRVR